MSQVPLAPPPQTGQPIDSWLYLLWRRLTQAGQILWASIVPGTSADVEGAVTDATGTAGSLVFSGNPTLDGITVTLNAATPLAPTAGTVIHQVGEDGINNTYQMDSYGGANAIRPVRANGTLGSPSALLVNNQIFATDCIGYDGTNYSNQANWIITATENWNSSAKGTLFALNLTPAGSTTVGQVLRVEGNGTTTLGGTSTAPALKVNPVASQARWLEATAATSSNNAKLNTNAGGLELGAAGVSAIHVNSSGQVTVGVSPPAFTNPFTVYATGAISAGMVGIGDGTGAQMVAIRASDDANQPQLIVQKRRGSWASPSAVASADALGDVVFQGYGGTNTRTLAYIRANVDTYTSDSDISSYLRFAVSPSGSASAIEAMRIAADKTVTMGGDSTAPAFKVIPVASQARWVEVTAATSSGNPQLATNAGELLLPQNIVLPKTSGKGIQVDTASPSFGWRDIIGQIGVKTAGATDPVWTLYRGAMYAYTFDTATAEAFLVFHIPHDYVPGSDLFAHVHWSQKVVDTGGTAGVPGVAEWKFDISYADGHGTAGGAADPFVAPITVTVTQQASTTQYGHMIAEVQFTNNGGTGGLIDSNTIQVDGLLLVRLYRVKANPADTLNQAPFVHTADIHYQSTNIGTKQKAPNFYT